MTDQVSALSAEEFVSLATYKRNGEKVATPMWLARDGDALVMWTPADSWKVKRLRRDDRVELTPCSRTGKVADGATTVTGTGAVDASPEATAHARGLVKAKYGVQFRIVTAIEWVIARGSKDRVALRLSV